MGTGVLGLHPVLAGCAVLARSADTLARVWPVVVTLRVSGFRKHPCRPLVRPDLKLSYPECLHAGIWGPQLERPPGVVCLTLGLLCDFLSPRAVDFYNLETSDASTAGCWFPWKSLRWQPKAQASCPGCPPFLHGCL